MIIHAALWLFINFLELPFGLEIYHFGVGNNYYIHNFGEYWRFVTPIFLHGDLMHALFNSFSLILFGPALEQMLGKSKFITAYLLAGIIGNIGTYIADPTAMYFHLGASGAIYGLFGIYVFMVFLRKHLIDPGNAQVVTTILIIGLVMTFIRPGINIYAHIFGFIGGFALGPLILMNAQPFSIYRNRRQKVHNGSPQFDPNRWNKRGIPSKIKKNILWIIIGILVAFGILGKFI